MVGARIAMILIYCTSSTMVIKCVQHFCIIFHTKPGYQISYKYVIDVHVKRTVICFSSVRKVVKDHKPLGSMGIIKVP